MTNCHFKKINIFFLKGLENNTNQNEIISNQVVKKIVGRLEIIENVSIIFTFLDSITLLELVRTTVKLCWIAGSF